ncbi:MAG: Crp/Fnr family transcriptional regulator [Elusimicrobia bacterium]|nr:Crp/Fnr family transcriptional regulator [Elusimicrobiota bacterium]
MGYKRTIAPHLECPFAPDQACRGCDCVKRCFFNFLSPESLKRFRAERRMRLYKARQVVFNEGDQPQGLYVLCVGDVKLIKADLRGRELTLMYLSCGDLMGEVSHVTGDPYGASAETMRDSVVCFVSRDLADHFAKVEPEFHRRLLLRVSRFMCGAIDRTFGFAFQSAESRLAGFLLAHRPPPAGLGKLPCHAKEPFSRREIAGNLGLSPETVIRTLSTFQRRRLIRLAGKSIEVVDRPGLESITQAS